MPLLRFKCLNSSCSLTFREFFRTAAEATSSIECVKCGGIAKKILGGPSSFTKITVDNGLNAKAVEIYPDQVEVFHDHAQSGGEKK